MTSSDSPAGAPEPDANRPEARQSQSISVLPEILAVAARELAKAPLDSDDAALLAILGHAIVPSLGEVVALCATDATGRFRLIAAAPDRAAPARQLHEHAEQHPDLLAEYVTMADAGRSTVGQKSGGAPAERSPEQSAAAGALGRAAGVVSEIVVPLGDNALRDGLLVIGSTDPGRRYEDTDRSAAEVLAAIVTIRRAASRHAVRETELRQQIEAISLAGRELSHLLNNDLTMPVGVVELLLDRNTSSPDLQEMLQAAAHDLAALEQHVRAFHDLMREHSSSPTP